MAASILLFAGPAWPAGETALWTIWRVQDSHPGEHQRIAGELAGFARSRPDDQLLPVVKTLHAWHLLKLDRPEEARLLLEQAISGNGSPIARGAGQIARGWLTLLARESLAETLNTFRRQHIRYPLDWPEIAAFIETLPADKRPPVSDRWGDTWLYREQRLRGLPHLPAMRYRLESRNLRGLTLDKALTLPYGDRIDLEPQSIVSAPNQPPIIRFRSKNAEPAASGLTLGLGARDGDISLAYASGRTILLHDRLHWQLLRPPAER